MHIARDKPKRVDVRHPERYQFAEEVDTYEPFTYREAFQVMRLRNGLM